MVTLSPFPLLGMMGLLVDMGYAHYRKQMAKAAAMSASYRGRNLGSEQLGYLALCAHGSAAIAAVCGPHADRLPRHDGVSPFRYFGVVRIKNCGFTGFAAGGQKGLWLSHTHPADRRLVLTESAVDALSYAALFPDAEDQTRYASPAANQVRGKRH